MGNCFGSIPQILTDNKKAEDPGNFKDEEQVEACVMIEAANTIRTLTVSMDSAEESTTVASYEESTIPSVEESTTAVLSEISTAVLPEESTVPSAEESTITVTAED